MKIDALRAHLKGPWKTPAPWDDLKMTAEQWAFRIAANHWDEETRGPRQFFFALSAADLVMEIRAYLEDVIEPEKKRAPWHVNIVEVSNSQGIRVLVLTARPA